MSLIIRELSAGEIASKSFGIYRKHFWVIMAAYLPLGLGTAVATRLLLTLFSDLTYLALAWFLSLILVSVADWVATAVVISVISDICLGHLPEVRRAYKKIGPGFIGRLLVTKLIYILAFVIGLGLFGVTALGVYLLALFHMVVLVVEDEWGGNAMRRSRQLGKDYYLRNLGVMLLMLFPYLLLWAASYSLSYFTPLNLRKSFPDLNLPEINIAGIISLAARNIIYPVLVVRVVLLYYDMRVRKEAFDNAALADELTF